MRVKLAGFCLLVAASAAAYGSAPSSDVERVGFAASVERLESVRAAAPVTFGPCSPGSYCTANVPCVVSGTGGCASPGAACTAGTVTGGVRNKGCDNTSSLKCYPVTLQGCTQTSVGCETVLGGCSCTRTLATPVNVGTVSSC